MIPKVREQIERFKVARQEYHDGPHIEGVRFMLPRTRVERTYQETVIRLVRAVTAAQLLVEQLEEEVRDDEVS